MRLIKLDPGVYKRVGAIHWLSLCGNLSRPNLPQPIRWIEDRTEVLQSMMSPQWANAITHALGCLTSHLAMTDYDTYGSQWSSLFAQSWKLLEDGIRGAVLDAIKVNDWVASFSRTQFPQLTPTIRASIGKQMADRMESKAWDQCLLTWILGQINAAAMEISFRHVFPGAPVFFERLLEVYDKGRLPCGWDGDLNEWADGRLMVH